MKVMCFLRIDVFLLVNWICKIRRKQVAENNSKKLIIILHYKDPPAQVGGLKAAKPRETGSSKSSLLQYHIKSNIGDLFFALFEKCLEKIMQTL